MPIFHTSTPKTLLLPPLDKFESFSLVSEGPNPFEDTIVIPFSRLILRRYEKVITHLQTVLLEMTQNRIDCLKRSITGIIPRAGQAGLFSPEESELMHEKIDEFYRTHPVGEIPTNVTYNTNLQSEKIQWYFNED